MIDKVRIDKWLWAARFFKTRSLAKTAVEGGKVRIAGKRLKASKEINTGTLLTIQQGWDEREIEVIELSEQRGSAKVAALLYSETKASIEGRELKKIQRQAMGSSHSDFSTKPNSKQRRQLSKAKKILDGD